MDHRLAGRLLLHDLYHCCEHVVVNGIVPCPGVCRSTRALTPTLRTDHLQQGHCLDDELHLLGELLQCVDHGGQREAAHHRLAHRRIYPSRLVPTATVARQQQQAAAAVAENGGVVGEVLQHLDERVHPAGLEHGHPSRLYT